MTKRICIIDYEKKKKLKYVVHSISFLTFLDWHFKLSRLLKIHYVIAISLIRWLKKIMISGSNERLLQQLEYTLLKPDCHSWWISKMQSGHDNPLEELYTMKFCFKLGKNATETYVLPQTAFWPSCMNRASVFEWHKRFKEARESRRDDKRRGRSKEHQSWLAKKLGLGLLCWCFKGVQEEIPKEEASTFQIGSVAFPAGQCTSPQLHPCHRLFDQDGHQGSSSPSL